MTTLNQTQKKKIKIPLINDFTNKKSINLNNFDEPRKTYNFESDNTNILNDSKIRHCLSEENNILMNNHPPSIASLSEEDNYNTYNKKNFDTNSSNGIKKIKNYPENGLYSDLLNNLNYNLNLNKPKINYLDYKLAQLNSELVAINSNNLMLKEDIYKYTDINKYLENEIKIQKEHNIDLLNINDKLIEENNNLNAKFINDSNEFNDLIQEKETKQKVYDEKQKNLEIKNNKINNDYDELISINNKTKNDYNTLCQNYDELNKKNIDVNNETNLLKEIQNKHFSDFEEKINNIISEIDILKKEQIALNKENKDNKNNFDLIQKEKENYFNKYQEQMLLNEKLTKELYNHKINLDAIKKIFLKKEKNSKKSKKRPASLIKKKELMKDLQKKIDDYKAITLRYSYMDDYYFYSLIDTNKYSK